MREWLHRPLRRCAERDYSEVLRIRCISAETEVVTLQTVKIDNIFTRIEKKYIVSDKQFAAMLPVLLQHMHVDSYGKSTVSSIYFDTADMRLIRASIEHPIYKEKLRLRCYGTPSAESNAFIELKKKYKGVVYKRRIEMPYADAMEFLCGDAPCPDKQIAREIDYALRFYPELRPSFGIFCERTAYAENGVGDLRLTIDENLRYRTRNLDLLSGTYGDPILPAGKCIMELKTPHTLPLWLAALLDEHRIFPTSFSKYATAYNIELNRILSQKRGAAHCG
jgi:hypothetical protein